jgi:hypothetical protein
MTDHALRDLAEQTTPHLADGWHHDETYPHPGAQIAHLDGRRLLLRIAWNKPGRVTVSGVFPDGHLGLVDCTDRGTITVRLDRGPEALAREITRRLLPHYESALAAVRERIAQANAARAAREALAQRITDLIPGARRTNIDAAARTHVVWYSHGTAFGSGTVAIFDAATTVSLDIGNLPAPVADRILTILAEAAEITR